MRDRCRGSTSRWYGAVAVGVLVLAGCGAEDPSAVAMGAVEEEPDATAEPEDAATEPVEASEPSDQDASGEDVQDGGGEPATGDADGDDGSGEGGGSGEEPALGACDLAGTRGAVQLGVGTYEQLTLEINFELELLVTDMAADLDELLSGVSDGPTLESQLAEHRAGYAEAVEPLRDVAPPEGASEWHERAMGSFDDVCTAIEDGLAGSAEGEEGRFEAFAVALTEFPALGNGLHANAACGPFETC